MDCDAGSLSTKDHYISPDDRSQDQGARLRARGAKSGEAASVHGCPAAEPTMGFGGDRARQAGHQDQGHFLRPPSSFRGSIQPSRWAYIANGGRRPGPIHQRARSQARSGARSDQKLDVIAAISTIAISAARSSRGGLSVAVVNSWRQSRRGVPGPASRRCSIVPRVAYREQGGAIAKCPSTTADRRRHCGSAGDRIAGRHGDRQHQSR